MLTLQHIAFIQENHKDDVSLMYHWHPSSKTPQALLRGVTVHFRRHHVKLWKYLMTEKTDGFEITIMGTRGGEHDDLLPCYVVELPEVNAAREKLGLPPVHR